MNGNQNINGRRDKPYVVLVLQGGGALGAYHLGAYRAMQEAGFAADWVSGISIGAVTATIIAGNHHENRLDRLQEFWDTVTWPGFPGEELMRGYFPTGFVKTSAAQTAMFGQPNFFKARIPMPQFGVPGTDGALSYADNQPLVETLVKLVNYDYLNSGKGPRLTLGATEVTTGKLVFFDNRQEHLAPAHTLASGALPPGFPPERIDGTLYWDGGVASNTPLQAVIDDIPPGHVVVFMIDLFDAHGEEPRTMDDVVWRQSQIQYASRTDFHIENTARILNARGQLSRLRESMPTKDDADPIIKEAEAAAYRDKMDFVHITFHPDPGIPPEAGHEFSRASVEARSEKGYRDMQKALKKQPWLDKKRPTGLGCRIHNMRHGEITSTAPGAGMD